MRVCRLRLHGQVFIYGEYLFLLKNDPFIFMFTFEFDVESLTEAIPVVVAQHEPVGVETLFRLVAGVLLFLHTLTS